jgi:hypothetical protein
MLIQESRPTIVAVCLDAVLPLFPLPHLRTRGVVYCLVKVGSSEVIN